jgi:hypothetical protein
LPMSRSTSDRLFFNCLYSVAAGKHLQ